MPRGLLGSAGPGAEAGSTEPERSARPQLRCLSRDHRNNEKELEGLSGRGQFAAQEVWTCCHCSVCSLSPGRSHLCVTPSLSAGALPSLSCDSCSTPAIQQLLSLPGPCCSLLGHVLSGNLGSSSRWDSSSNEAHYAKQSQGQHLTCAVWLRRVGHLRCSLQALVQVSNEGLISKLLLQLLVREN